MVENCYCREMLCSRVKHEGWKVWGDMMCVCMADMQGPSACHSAPFSVLRAACCAGVDRIPPSDMLAVHKFSV